MNKLKSIIYVIALALFSTHFVLAVELKPGDIVIAENGDNWSTDSTLVIPKLLRLDPQTNDVTEIVKFNHLSDPGLMELAGLNIDQNKNVIVAITKKIPQTEDLDQIVRVDPKTGDLTIVSKGGSFENIRDMIIDAEGNYIVAQHFGILRVNSQTGDQTFISRFGFLGELEGISLDANGNIYVVDSEAQRIVRVNAIDGTQSIVFTASQEIPYGAYPFDIKFDSDGSLIVASSGQLSKLDVTTNQITLISDHPALSGIFEFSDIDINDSGNFMLVLNDVGSISSIARVNRSDGLVTVLYGINRAWKDGLTSLVVVKSGSGDLLPNNNLASFNASNGILDLPAVKVGDLLFSAQLKMTENMIFSLVSASPVNIQANSDTPSFSFASGILSIPIVTVGVNKFTATLQYQNDNTFVLLNATPIS